MLFRGVVFILMALFSGAIGSLIILVYAGDHVPSEVTGLAIVWTYTAARIFRAIDINFLVPNVPAYRHFNLTDEEATGLYRWLISGASLSIAILGLCIWMDSLGLDQNTHKLALMTGSFSAAFILSVIAYVFREPVGDPGGHGASRLVTLLPILRNFLLITIVVIAGMIALSEIGVDIAPLLAGAGVVGLAIGFGAQTLIRDISSGAFFLVDDAFRKGEYIDIGSAKGTVEKISIRSFQLRHHRGALNTVPFGEIKHITNYSRDWVLMKLPVRVTYDTDIERVRKLVKNLGQELLDDPELGPKFLQPLKSQGVAQMEDSAMIIRLKFMTRPGDQFTIRPKVFMKIRELFEREGIKFAHREVTVRSTTGEMPDPALLAKAAGAAGEPGQK